ncbi:SDR family NAD(P)-dependent oxidoreductase [Plantactinospora sp. GCM10030261]|uniref:SDR family NAD(P)-dependent oxidoreductase n=1 Tax=Plantactinospora sp. GCM10030261 TaxID=3273420 RepID=UPI0036133705
MDIRGATALITGAASGLGQATAHALAGVGANVVLLDTDTQNGHQIAKQVGGEFTPGDVRNPHDLARSVQVAAAAGPLRVVVNCAGVGDGGRILDREGSPHDLARFERVIGINLTGTFNVLRLSAATIAKLPANGDGERGVIINTASIAGIEGQVGQVAYAASKGGVIGLTLAAARDLGSHGIRVVTIAPGVFATSMADLMPQATRDTQTSNLAFPHRPGQPAEFAALVLAVIANPYLNGETIRLDAGLRMTRR